MTIPNNLPLLTNDNAVARKQESETYLQTQLYRSESDQKKKKKTGDEERLYNTTTRPSFPGRSQQLDRAGEQQPVESVHKGNSSVSLQSLASQPLGPHQPTAQPAQAANGQQQGATRHGLQGGSGAAPAPTQRGQPRRQPRAESRGSFPPHCPGCSSLWESPPLTGSSSSVVTGTDAELVPEEEVVDGKGCSKGL